MKKIVLLALVANVCLWGQSAHAIGKSEQSPNNEKNVQYWEQMANGMAQALINNFWGASFDGYEDRYYFNYGSNLSNMTTDHYWPQAHAMDVIIDAYMRTKDKQYKAIYPLWWQGAPRFNFAGNKIRKTRGGMSSWMIWSGWY